MAISNPEVTKRRVGLLSATDAIIARRGHPRVATKGSGHLRPLSPGDVTRLLRPDAELEKKHFECKLDRYCAHALQSSVHRADLRAALKASGAERKELGVQERTKRGRRIKSTKPKPRKRGQNELDVGIGDEILDKHERKRVKWHRDRDADPDNDACVYCLRLDDLLYGDEPSPVVVVTHQAHIDTNFDPETSVSDARIENFMILVPEPVAFALILQAHPLYWEKAAPGLFNASAPAQRFSDGIRWGRVMESDDAKRFNQWTNQPGNPKYIYESVTMRQNEDLTADVENIIAISGFELDGFGAAKDFLKFLESRRLADFEKIPQKKTKLSLKYDYSLESCLVSNYGVAWETGGLDIDGGSYFGKAIPYRNVSESDVESLDERDLAHLSAATSDDDKLTEKLYKTKFSPRARLEGQDKKAENAKVKQKVIECAGELKKGWKDRWKGYDPWLVTISASKRVRFTLPSHGPPELWSLLTHTAPTALFNFLNDAVCKSAHTVTKLIIDSELAVSSQGAQNGKKETKVAKKNQTRKLKTKR